MIYHKIRINNLFFVILKRDWRNDNTSVITLGGVDRSHFDGPLTWVPVVNDEWKVNLTS
jgi:hypothetical protein